MARKFESAIATLQCLLIAQKSFSTVLSLLVVPVVFTSMDDLEHFFKRSFAKLRRLPKMPAGESAKTNGSA